MRFTRIEVVQFLRDQDRSEDASHALEFLPTVVDTESDGGRLAQLGISGQQMIDALRPSGWKSDDAVPGGRPQI